MMPQLAFLVLIQAVAALGLARPDLSQPSSSLGTFENPSVKCRPRFRYWLPDSWVDPEIVAANIKDSGALGACGVEFVPFYNYGGEAGDPPAQADWVAQWVWHAVICNVFRAALQAHKNSRLVDEFCHLPESGSKCSCFE